MSPITLVSSSLIRRTSYSFEAFPDTCEFLLDHANDRPDLSDIIEDRFGKVLVRPPKQERDLEIADLIIFSVAEALATWEVEPIPDDHSVGRALHDIRRSVLDTLSSTPSPSRPDRFVPSEVVLFPLPDYEVRSADRNRALPEFYASQEAKASAAS